MIAEDARRKADQALLLARVFATVLTLAVGMTSILAGPIALKFERMFAEIGGELTVISKLIVDFPAVWMIGMLVLIGVTLFFVWAKGSAAVWMAGLGLLLLAIAFLIVVSAIVLPFIKIVNEMVSL